MNSKEKTFIDQVNFERKFGNMSQAFLTDVYDYFTNVKEIEQINEDELIYTKLSSYSEFSTLTAENLAQLLKYLMNNVNYKDYK
jgi:esterase/lipase